MLDTVTKKRIDDCRDILVGKLPDPKAQIEQITIGLIYKFMDDMDKEAIEMGGKAKFFSDYSISDPENPKKKQLVPFKQYSWNNLFNAKVTATEMLRLYSEAISEMDKNPNIPQLFRDIFKNAYLPYRDPETLKMFLKTINEFEYTHSEKLGDAFEYLLSVMGSQGDAGQFRTPRHIIDFIVAAVNPLKTDTVLDPACGTAGFLISAFKHIRENNTKGLTPDERKRLIHNFVGYDISPDMVRLSLVNLYLHGFSEPHIWEYDTLSSEERWDETFDVVLANPPFMSPKGGIRPHKKFSISSNRSEVLFVDYIAEHLNPKGRAGIIVPEGVMFQSGTAYKELRKMLVDNYLYAVVSLPAGVFNPYSGVKTSVLLMDKQISKKGDSILFVKIDNDGYGLGAQRNAIKGSQLEEAVELLKQFKGGNHTGSKFSHVVSKKEIGKSGDYILSGERYINISVANSDFKLVELSNETIFKVVSGGTPSSSENKFWNGEINWITLADLPQKDFITFINGSIRKITVEGLKNSSAKMLPKNSILVSTRATIGRIAINKIECCTNQGFKNIIINDFSKANTIFVALMMTELIHKMNEMATGGTFKELSTSSFRSLQIPLPPLTIQEEMVNEIDVYQRIIDGAKLVLENYKPKIDINPEWAMVKLGEVCEHITKGTTPTTNGFEWQEKGINFIKVQNINVDGTISKDKISFINQECHDSLRRSQLEENDILFSIAGTQMGITGMVDLSLLPANTNQALAIIRAKQEFLPSFIKHYLMSENVQNDMERLKVGVAQSNLSLKQVSEIKIPKIDLKTQTQIVDQIENEQTLISANKALIKIFDQKIKLKIAKVWGK